MIHYSHASMVHCFNCLLKLIHLRNFLVEHFSILNKHLVYIYLGVTYSLNSCPQINPPFVVQGVLFNTSVIYSDDVIGIKCTFSASECWFNLIMALKDHDIV